MAAVMAVSLLTACGGPGSSAGVALNASKIEALLEAREVDAAVTADKDLSDAVKEAAAALAARTFEEVDAMDVKGLVAQKAGVVPLVCEVSSDAPYWGDSPLQYANRYQERAADLLDSLGDGGPLCHPGSSQVGAVRRDGGITTPYHQQRPSRGTAGGPFVCSV